jgi:hypothetical protein
VYYLQLEVETKANNYMTTSFDTRLAEPTPTANMETYTTDDALAAMGFGKFQALVLAYAGMGWVAEAMELMLLSFVGPLVREEWNVSAQDESLLSSVVFVGMLIGACSWGYISDTYGRR